MSKRGRVSLGIIGLVFAGLGLLFGGLGGMLYVQEQDFIASAACAPGKVTALTGGKAKKPVVTFSAAAEGDTEAREFQITGKVSSSPPAYVPGEQVTVLYPPGRPEDGHLEGFLEQYFLSALFGGLGGIFFLIGAGLFFAFIKDRVTQEPQTFGAS